MEKYTRVFYFDDPLYLKNSPVIVVAGAILKNNEYDEILAQLKFKNISNKKIKYVDIELKLYDQNGESQRKVINYQYLDLNIFRNEDFGSQEPIILPYNNTRSFEVIVKKVVYDNEEIWTNNKKFCKIKKQQELSSILESMEIEYFMEQYGEKSKFIPYIEQDIWICSCGCINSLDEKKCYDCNLEKDIILNIEFDELKKEALYDISIHYLESSIVSLIKEAKDNFEYLGEYKTSKEKVEECKEKLKKEENKNKKIKKITILILTIIILIKIVCSIANIISNNKKNQLKYEQANNLFNELKYEEAIKIYEELGNYKDSNEKKELLQLYSNIEKFNSEDGSGDFFNQNMEKFELINDNNQLKKIIVNKWLVSNVNSKFWQIAIIDKDGKDYDPVLKGFRQYLWKVEGGYLYYSDWNGIFRSVYDFEVRKVIDGVYLLVGFDKDDKDVKKESSYIFVLYDSEISKTLNLELENIPK